MNDLIVALRLLRKNPGFTVVAVLTLAIGIGATTIVFTIVKGVLLQPLDYPDSERIVLVWEGDHKKGFSYGYNDQTSPRNFLDWREQNTVFESMGLMANHWGAVTRSFIFADGKQAYNLEGRFVSKDFFSVFGLQPMLGRTFLTEEEIPGSRRVVVVSHRFWTNQLDQEPNVIGRTIALENNGRHVYEIIGVMPEGFRFPNSDVWISMAHMPLPPYRRGGDVMTVVARLKDGVTREEAQAQMNVLQWRIYNEYRGLELLGADLKVRPNIELEPLLHAAVSRVNSSLTMFMGAVGLLLLISVANVANLLLSRALSRQTEMSVRAALGAQRWDLVKQLLTESLALALAGGIAGVLLAWLGLQLVLKFNAGAIPRAENVTIAWPVLVFTLVLAMITGVLFGFAPALQTSRPNLMDAMRSGANRQTAGRSHGYIRNAFSVLQVSLALILLIGAALLMQSFGKLQNVDPGIDAKKLLAVELSLTGAAYPKRENRVAFLRRILDEMRASPGVESVAAVSVLAVMKGWPYPYSRSDRAPPSPNEMLRAGLRSVTADYHKTYGLQVLRGRSFTEGDDWPSERVLMINQALADSAFKGEDPMGKQLRYSGRNWRIIGVFANHKNNGLARDTDPEVNIPYQQWEGLDAQSVFLTLRVNGDPLALAPVVTQKVRALNADQPLNQFLTMQTYLDYSKAGDKFRSLLVSMFAGAALFLASIGIYGVISYSVAQRTSEMGIRLALGAQRSDLLGMILKQGLKLTLSGVVVGLLGSFVLTRVLSSLLFGINSSDVSTFIGVAVVLTLVGIAASIVPAIRATRVSPAVCLRTD